MTAPSRFLAEFGEGPGRRLAIFRETVPGWSRRHGQASPRSVQGRW